MMRFRPLSKLRPWQTISLLFIALLTFSILSLGSVPPEAIHPGQQQPLTSRVLSKLLPQFHYNHQAINNSVSSQQLDFYLEFLDRNRMYFLAQDIEEFEKYRYQLDDAITSGQIEPAYIIFNTYTQRLAQRVDYVDKLLQHPFDFTVDESFKLDRENEPWASSAEELNELWREKVKNEALNLELAGKDDWPSVQNTLTKRYANFEKRIEQWNSEDVFQLFMNALAQTYDPHTAYLSPRTSENFEIDMSLSFQGIGAQLTTEDDYTKVVRILPGGPADKSELLWPDDKIVGVGQDEDGEIVDVIGMRLDDVVQMIRGQKGTKVRLEIIPADSKPGGPTKIISLVRDKVDITEREAKSEVKEIQRDGQVFKLGVIDVPSFYSDLNAQRRGDQNYKSTTRDVRHLLSELRSQDIDGLIIDLRQNGGGSLQEAIELTGLFIPEGPVVQVRNSFDDLKVETDPDPATVYDGPLAVLIDRYSASASEIFAAAIQDYGRGIILGGQSYGKGTVQSLVGLDRFIKSRGQEFGELKVTIAKFYRISGGTTQHRGVIPDITLPSIYSEMKVGESTQKNALPWDQVKPAVFEPEDRVVKYLPKLREYSQQRMAQDPEFQYIREDIEQYKEDQAHELVSLQKSKRQAERNESDAKRLERANERRARKGLAALKQGDEIPKADQAPDVILDEGTHILADYIMMSESVKTTKVNLDEIRK